MIIISVTMEWCSHTSMCTTHLHTHTHIHTQKHAYTPTHVEVHCAGTPPDTPIHTHTCRPTKVSSQIIKKND